MKKIYTFAALMLALLFFCLTGHTQCITVSISGGACSGSGITAAVSSIPAVLELQRNGISIQRNAPSWTQQALTVAGGNGSGSGAGQFNNYSSDIAIDAQHNLYILDRYNYRVQKWVQGAAEGVTVAGGNNYGSNSNQLGFCTSLCLDGAGNMYIADFSNYRVQKWAPGATEGVTVAGGNGQGDNLNQVSPTAIGLDAAGNLYVVEYDKARVTKWAPGATEGVIAAGGNGPGNNDNQLNYPTDIYVEPDGALYIINGGNTSTIVKWLPGAGTGSIVLEAKGDQYYGLMKDAAGYFYFIRRPYINNAYTPQVSRFSEGDFTPGNIIATSYGSGSGQLIEAYAACLDEAGNMYILDPGNFRVQKFSVAAIDQQLTAGPSGNYQAVTTAFNGCINASNTIATAQSPIVQPLNAAICAGSSTQLSVTNSGSFTWNPGGQAGSSITVSPPVTTVYTVSDNSSQCTSLATVYVDEPVVATINGTECLGGNLTLTASKPPLRVEWKRNDSIVGTSMATYTTTNAISVAGPLVNARGICFDLQGNIYAAESGAARVTKWAPGATQGEVVAGGNGQGSDANQLFWPQGVFVDKKGNIYVADQLNARIQKFIPGAANGITVAGGNGSGSELHQLNSPWNVFVDDEENVYVAEYSNARITKWAPGATTGMVVAGGNGAGAAANQLNAPNDVIVDAAGNIYISDQSNHRVQKWAPGASSGTTIASGRGTEFDLSDYPSGIALDALGNVYVINSYTGNISRWEPGGTTGTYLAGYCCSGTGSLRSGNTVRIDKSGNLYAVDYSNGVAWKYPPNNNSAVYTPTVKENYTAVITSFGGCTSAADTFSFPPSPGDTAVFGNNTWNVYAFNAGGATDTGHSWNIHYNGYYTDTTLSFDTRTKWNENLAPSAAPGYQGCTVANDDHSWSAKRQGFPCGHYRINIPNHDDEARLYINGEKVWEHIGCCDTHTGIWEGDLGPDSKIEFQGTEGGGASSGAITLVPFTPVITPAGFTDLCYGGTVALSSNSATNNQWYKDGVALEGDTAQIYTAAATGQYKVRLINTTGCMIFSPAISVTVSDTPPPGDPVVFGNNAWNVYAFNAGGQKDTGTSWNTGYSGYYIDSILNMDTRNKWAQANSPSFAPGYQGCPVNLDNHSWTAKRQGFPCGRYVINIPEHDDDAQLFVNGVKVWDSNNPSDPWQGELGPDSKIEFRVTEGGGWSYGVISFTPVGITASGPTTFCPGYGIDLTAPSGTAYLWNNNLTSQTIHVTDSGTYTAIVTYAGGCTDTVSEQINVQPVAKPVVVTDDPNICTYGYAYLYTTNWTGGYSYNCTLNGNPVNRDSLYIDAYGFVGSAFPGTYIMTAKDALGCTSEPSDPVIFTAPPGNPDDFGADKWNVYLFNNGIIYGYDIPWQHFVADYYYGVKFLNAYNGYYTDEGLSFDTRNKWNEYTSPASAPGFMGCGLPYGDGYPYSWSARRKGFPCGSYVISIPAHKSSAELYVDNILVWQEAGEGNGSTNVWQGILGPESRIEFRTNNTDYYQACYGAISIVLVEDIVIAKPVITPPGPVAICANSSVVLTSSATTGNTWNTGETTQSIVVNIPGNYYVTAANSAGCSAQSDPVVVTVTPSQTYYADNDNDGYGDAAASIQACTQPAGYVINSRDCNDANAAVHPGAIEICDGLDNNCNGRVDEGCLPVTVSISDASLTEGNRGKSGMTFTVTLSQPSNKRIYVQYATQDGTATAGSDYTTKSGVLSFPAGTIQRTIVIPVTGDRTAEADESFSVLLTASLKATITRAAGTGIIFNDDGTLAASISKTDNAAAQQLGVLLMPNPAKDFLNLRLTGYSGRVTLQLTTLHGSVIRQELLQVSGTLQHRMELGRIAVGTYLLMVVDDKGNRHTEKVIIAR